MKWVLIIFAIGLIVFCFCACVVSKRSDERAIEMFRRFIKEKDREIQD